MATREQILEAGRELLRSEGLRAITTNEIARRARVSKKTLYRFFPTKDELIKEIVVSFMEGNLTHWDAILQRDVSAMDLILASLDFVGQFMPLVQSHLVSQAPYMSPSLWARIDEIRMKRLKKLKGLLAEAQKDGYFRADVNPDHWIFLLTGTIQSVVTPTVLLREGLSLVAVLDSIKSIYYEGLLTEKGRAYIANKENQE